MLNRMTVKYYSFRRRRFHPIHFDNPIRCPWRQKRSPLPVVNSGRNIPVASAFAHSSR